MARSTEIAPHESIIIHESLRATIASLAQLETMHQTTQHPELKQALERALRDKGKEIEELKKWAQRIVS